MNCSSLAKVNLHCLLTRASVLNSAPLAFVSGESHFHAGAAEWSSVPLRTVTVLPAPRQLFVSCGLPHNVTPNHLSWP